MQQKPGEPAKQPRFFVDVFKISAGTAVAQAIVVLAAPVLTRLYAPEAFGIAATFMSVVAVLGAIACLRFDLTIMLPGRDETAANLLMVSILASLAVALLTIPLVWFAGRWLAEAIGNPAIEPYLWLVPFGVLIQGMTSALSYWHTRTKRFALLSVAQVNGQLTGTSTNLAIGFAGFGSGGTMIEASVASQVVAALTLGNTIWRSDRRLFRSALSLRDMVAGVSRYKSFPLFGSWSGLFNTLSWQMPVLILGVFFSPVVVGFYALGFRILQMPMSLVGRAIGQVFFQRAAEARRQGLLGALVERLFQRLLMIGLPLMLTLTFVGRDLYFVVFGAAWAEAGVYTQILSLWALFWFISSPLSTLLGVLEKQEFALKFNAVLLATRVLTLAAGGWMGSARLALALYAASGILAYGYLNLATMREAGLALRGIGRLVARELAFVLPYGGALLAAQMVDGAPVHVLVSATIFFVAFVLFRYWKDRS